MTNIKRTTVNLEPDLVAEARAVLGTSNTIDTIHGALREVVRRERLRRLSQREFEWLTPERLKAIRRGAKPSDL